MIDADLVVCTDCGNLHLEGSGGPRSVAACAACEGDVTDVELDDLVGL
jgi:hypothetical protein